VYFKLTTYILFLLFSFPLRAELSLDCKYYEYNGSSYIEEHFILKINPEDNKYTTYNFMAYKEYIEKYLHISEFEYIGYSGAKEKYGEDIFVLDRTNGRISIISKGSGMSDIKGTCSKFKGNLY